MKLSVKELIAVSFMLFSLFFGAGNLIFPPFLGQNAAANTVPALLGFLTTAVVLPVLAVIVVAEFDGLDKLGRYVGKRFAVLFTVVTYLALGPCLAIPRAASVPYEMAVAPYLPEGANVSVWMIAYSLVFFVLAVWLCMKPGKLMDWLGNLLTPLLLLLLVVLFGGFMLRGEVSVAEAQEAYVGMPFLTGFAEGYNTMDTLAGLNFGMVVATTLAALGMRNKRDKIRYTLRAGVIAGAILAVVYVMLTYMGMASSGVYPIQENGAWTLRHIVYQVFGAPGAILLAAIFTLACLTTCVGLINSIAQYFSELIPVLGYRGWVFAITAFSFVICNMGLNTILSFSVPVLNAIYPMAIVLILLGLTHGLWRRNRFVYPFTVLATGVVSVVYAVEAAGISLGKVGELFGLLPLYSMGFGWFSVAAVALVIGIILGLLCGGEKRWFS